MTSPEVVLYTGPACPYCERAKMLLERKRVSYQEIRVDRDPGEFSTMLERSGGRRSVPQIFIGDYHVGGFDDMSALNLEGKLDPLLAGEPA